MTRSGSVALCAFRVGGTTFALPVEDVREILPPRDLTPVPCARTEIAGLFGLRGEIVTAVDLRVRFGAAFWGLDGPHVHLIVAGGEHLTSLIVDAVEDVVSGTDLLPEDLPERLRQRHRGAVVAMHRGAGRTLLELDLRRILAGAGGPRPGVLEGASSDPGPAVDS